MKFDKTLKTVKRQVFSEMAYGASPQAATITKQELLQKIRDLTEPTSIRFTAVTNATYKKKNPLGTIYKVSMVESEINVNYAKEKEGKMQEQDPAAVYVPGKTYGTHETSTIVNHNDKAYIQVKPLKAESPRFVVKTNIGTYEIKQKAEVQEYLSPPRPDGPTDVVIRRYQLDSIVAIEIGDDEFKVSDVENDRKSVLDTINF